MFLPYVASERLVNRSHGKLLQGNVEGFFEDVRLAHALSNHGNFRAYINGG